MTTIHFREVLTRVCADQLHWCMQSTQFVGMRLRCAINEGCAICDLVSRCLEEWRKFCGWWRSKFPHDYTRAWFFKTKESWKAYIRSRAIRACCCKTTLVSLALPAGRETDPCRVLWLSFSFGPSQWRGLACGVEWELIVTVLGDEVAWCAFEGDGAGEAEEEKGRTEPGQVCSVRVMSACLGTLVLGTTNVLRYRMFCSIKTRLFGRTCLNHRMILIKAWLAFVLIIESAGLVFSRSDTCCCQVPHGCGRGNGTILQDYNQLWFSSSSAMAFRRLQDPQQVLAYWKVLTWTGDGINGGEEQRRERRALLLRSKVVDDWLCCCDNEKGCFDRYHLGVENKPNLRFFVRKKSERSVGEDTDMTGCVI